jgi:hypothetical protein
VAAVTGPTTFVNLERPLRSRFSFHGDELDELNVSAGVALTGIALHPQWWLAMDDSTGRVGLIPTSFVMEL